MRGRGLRLSPERNNERRQRISRNIKHECRFAHSMPFRYAVSLCQTELHVYRTSLVPVIIPSSIIRSPIVPQCRDGVRQNAPVSTMPNHPNIPWSCRCPVVMPNRKKYSKQTPPHPSQYAAAVIKQPDAFPMKRRIEREKGKKEVINRAG